MATPYDNWKTNVEETNEDAWGEAVEKVADDVGIVDKEEFVDVLARADLALSWVCGAVELPQALAADFAELVKMAQDYRKRVDMEIGR